MVGNPFKEAIQTCLEALPPELLQSLELTITSLVSATPKTYSTYEPLLLLPAHTFAAPEWTLLLSCLHDGLKDAFFGRLAAAMKVTHIALNSPIAPSISNEPTKPKTENVQRRPNITPLFGRFGTFLSDSPTKEDFDNAFWVSTRQNGIAQTWAPLYTMFSRGNITEKARLLALPAVKSSVHDPKGCTAVDLFAGIGYFTFSYAKAGCAKVVGFELNPWSVEGLRRGASANKWSCTVIKPEEMSKDYCMELKSTVTVFQMSNKIAGNIIKNNRRRLPPVRHINLGLLPSSSGACEVAVECLGPEVGGWIHIHENFATKEIANKSDEVKLKIRELVYKVRGEGWDTRLEHIERVKTYAPGVMHCVLDICLLPSSHSS